MSKYQKLYDKLGVVYEKPTEVPMIDICWTLLPTALYPYLSKGEELYVPDTPYRGSLEYYQEMHERDFAHGLVKKTPELMDKYREILKGIK